MWGGSLGFEHEVGRGAKVPRLFFDFELRLTEMATKKTRGIIPIDPAEVRELAATCHTKAEIYRRLGITSGTLDRRLDDPVYAKAFEEGRAMMRDRLMASAQKLCDDGNPQMIMFLLKTQFGFVETQKQVITDETSASTDGGLKAIYARIAETAEPKKRASGRTRKQTTKT